MRTAAVEFGDRGDQEEDVIAPKIDKRIQSIRHSGQKQDITYVVKPGDWLSKIAPRFGIGWRDLVAFNSLSPICLNSHVGSNFSDTVYLPFAEIAVRSNCAVQCRKSK